MSAAPVGAEPVFALRDVGVDRAGRAVVDGVSLTVEQGEVVALMGPNGAGKSTLLATMAGDVRPDRGTVRLNGRPLADWSALQQARQRAVLPQQQDVGFAFTAAEIVLLGRSPHDGGRPGATDRAIAAEAMRRTGALALADRRFPTLSGGERARVMLARAFAQVLQPATTGAPRALLLDEPTAALDIAHQHLVFDAVRALAADGVAVVVVLHDPNLAAGFADRVALIRDGRVLAFGPVATTLTEALAGACFAVTMRRVPHPTRDVPLLVAVPD